MASHTWRSIARAWPTALLGLAWKVGDGQTIRFWKDDWVGDMGPLQQLAYADIPDTEANLALCHYANDYGQWRWNEFQHLLPPNLLSQIAAITPPTTQETANLCFWKLFANGNFSVSSAYHILRETELSEPDARWKLIWEWPGNERTKLFLWLTL